MRFIRVAFLLAVVACQNPFDLSDAVAQGAVQFTPDARDRLLWDNLEVCSGLRGNFDAVRWYVMPNGMQAGGVNLAGRWVRDGNAILLTPPYKADWKAISHEEMHALLRGGANHPARFFNGACGDLRMSA